MRYSEIIKSFKIIDSCSIHRNGSYIELLFGIRTTHQRGKIIREYAVCDRYAHSGEFFHHLDTFIEKDAITKWKNIIRATGKR